MNTPSNTHKWNKNEGPSIQENHLDKKTRKLGKSSTEFYSVKLDGTRLDGSPSSLDFALAVATHATVRSTVLHVASVP